MHSFAIARSEISTMPIVAFISPAKRADSGEEAEITSGGCGFCRGFGQIEICLNWKCSPCQPNGSGSVQQRRISSIASRCRDQDWSGGMLGDVLVRDAAHQAGDQAPAAH